MRVVYAVVLVIGVVTLIGWMLFHGVARNGGNDRLDPEIRFGLAGRRVIAGLFGFGMAGMSAEFAAREIAAPLVFALAVLGAGAAVWWAGVMAEVDLPATAPAEERRD